MYAETYIYRARIPGGIMGGGEGGEKGGRGGMGRGDLNGSSYSRPLVHT